MIPYRHVRMELMTSKEVAEYLKTNDMVILPVGCFEMHGPRIPLGCDSFLDWASALLLADTWKCLAMPPVFYTFPGASGPWPGTVDISPRITEDYVKAIVLALLKGGFRRIVISGAHGPFSTAATNITRSIYQETGHALLGLHKILMPEDLMMEELGYEWGEDIHVLAALKILGLHGAYEPTAEIDRPREFPLDTIGPLRKHGAAVPWIFSRDYQHTGIRSCVRMEHADKAVEIMKKAAARMADLPEQYREYQEQMRAMQESPPWKDSDVWSI